MKNNLSTQASSPLKMLFFIQKNLPSSRIRILDVMPSLKTTNNITTDFIFLNEKSSSKFFSLLKKFSYWFACKNYDVVVLQKHLLHSIDLFFLRFFAKVLVFDVDDAVYYIDDTEASSHSKSKISRKIKRRKKRFHNVIQKSDFIVAGNSFLKEKILPHNPHVTIIPSCINMQNTISHKHTEKKTTIIGWIGTQKNLHYLALLMPILQKLAQTHSLQLNICSDIDISIPSLKTQFIPWKLEDQEKIIASFDIGVMPLAKTEWSQGKCGYKALQYMASKIPTIATDIGVNRQFIIHGETGFLAKNINDFYNPLKLLIEDPLLRKTIGENAQKLVHSQYDLSIASNKWNELLQKIQDTKSP